MTLGNIFYTFLHIYFISKNYNQNENQKNNNLACTYLKKIWTCVMFWIRDKKERERKGERKKVEQREENHATTKKLMWNVVWDVRKLESNLHRFLDGFCNKVESLFPHHTTHRRKEDEKVVCFLCDCA